MHANIGGPAISSCGVLPAGISTMQEAFRAGPPDGNDPLRRQLPSAQAAKAEDSQRLPSRHIAGVRAEARPEDGTGPEVSAKRKGALNPRRHAFVHHYTAGAEGVRGNGRESARAAGFTGADGSLDVTASRLLRDAKVAAAIRKLHSKADQKVVERLVDWKLEVPACRDTLVSVRDGKVKRGAAVRVLAAEKLLDRALGKPKVFLGASDGAQVKSITVKFVRGGEQ